ncbi:MAG TPA: hypothetical protein PKD09_17855 [Aggregatilinea sp.]|uniref:hypothetical protein n=1 Tax=Aggregatilinea sp. TaxID=2806333 RepID=UPI002CE8491B|nr:hypothetical protein [Aggregatilinea sp.]HML23526.1 hypothetical protein [Aggregatilinea sp.]
MARIFTDGFELGAWHPWMNLGSHASITTGSKRSGDRGLHLDQEPETITGYAGDRYITLPVTRTDTELYFRAAMRFPGMDTGFGKDFYVLDEDGVTLMYLDISTTAMNLYVLGALQDTWEPVGGISNATWYLVEVHFVQDASSGTVEVRVDGTVRLSFTGTTKSTGDVIRQFRLAAEKGAHDVYMDDVAINDTTGSADTSWPGEGKIILLTPNANGDSSEWTGSDSDQTDNYALVDDVPNDGDTTYVQTSDADMTDLYGLSSYTLAAGEAVRGVQVLAVARCVTAESDTLKLGVKSTAEHFGDAQALTTGYATYVGDWLATNPDTLAAWSQSDLDDLQAGIQS